MNEDQEKAIKTAVGKAAFALPANLLEDSSHAARMKLAERMTDESIREIEGKSLALMLSYREQDKDATAQGKLKRAAYEGAITSIMPEAAKLPLPHQEYVRPRNDNAANGKNDAPKWVRRENNGLNSQQTEPSRS